MTLYVTGVMSISIDEVKGVIDVRTGCSLVLVDLPAKGYMGSGHTEGRR